MSPSIKQKKVIPVFLVALVLVCFAISRSDQAAEPSGIQNVSPFNPPFRQRITLTMEPGTLFAARQFALPAGKTLVVEFVSAEASLPAGEQPIVLEIAALDPRFLRKDSSHDLLWNFIARAQERDFFRASQLIRLYVLEGEDINASASRNTSQGWAQITVDITGYLVATP